MWYIVTISILALVYILVILLMKYMKNVKITNAIFVLCAVIPYLALVITVYNDVGFYDWNFQNTLPVANVSPFMFVCSPLAIILPKKIKKYFLLLVSLLSVGMFLSSILGCIYNAIINYKFHIHFTYDYVAHISLSLLGVYAIRTKQVELTIRNALISSALIIAVATIMLTLNVIFDTAFFGLSLNGKHSVYNVVLVSNSYLSALIYYIGLSIVLISGYFYCKLLTKKQLSFVN